MLFEVRFPNACSAIDQLHLRIARNWIGRRNFPLCLIKTSVIAFDRTCCNTATGAFACSWVPLVVVVRFGIDLCVPIEQDGVFEERECCSSNATFGQTTTNVCCTKLLMQLQCCNPREYRYGHGTYTYWDICMRHDDVVTVVLICM